MNALLMEPYSPETQVFIEELNSATGCNVYQAQSVDEGLAVIRDKHPDVMLVSHEQIHAEAWRVVERIRCEARDALIKYPYIILLSTKPLPVTDAAKCRDLQAVCLFRQFWPAIFQEVAVASWMRQTRKFRSTIRIEFDGPSYSLHFCTSTSSRQIQVAARPAELAVILARGRESYTVEEVADALGVCRQTIKKYFCELRRASLDVQANLLIPEPDEGIFWMERRPGGTVCGVKANLIRG